MPFMTFAQIPSSSAQDQKIHNLAHIVRSDADDSVEFIIKTCCMSAAVSGKFRG